MSDTVIRVENLGKKYIIGHQQQERYTALRDVIANKVKSLGTFIQNPKSQIQNSSEEFWALKDVSFEIKQGDRVGIIGRNGAGKSTLLKILSRITEPTKGSIKIKGRVASLLEVGTGFHPELTGRENIYLNGAILGMSKEEIKRKFDEIVAFAEIEKFLDTPVKRYSSGMYVRLAFAVAAHLEPEILIVDEVLAVGDAQFQKKCLGKMEDVGKEGRTVLFVSHNMSTIQKLCSTGIFLQSGKILVQGITEKVVDSYLDAIKQNIRAENLQERKDRQGTGRVRIIDFFVVDKLGEKQPILRSGEDYIFVIEYETIRLNEKLNNVIGSIAITDNKGEIVFLVRSNFTNQNFSIYQQFGKIECHIKDFNLTTGVYTSMLFLSHREVEILDFIENATEVIVESGDFFGTGSIGSPSHCKVLTRADWRVI
ncbi:MAG: ABC transporter ATP-binding protein [Gloeotrichia echinulata DEX184]|jgi:lipopolysaccharide transport system ATP-binding protein|nr:ABC transporter ATP-binding protein [Gloeotrichia echinulata DEX184]